LEFGIERRERQRLLWRLNRRTHRSNLATKRHKMHKIVDESRT
jgi:hypothetical protein